jgi:hypothetical protein
MTRRAHHISHIAFPLTLSVATFSHRLWGMAVKDSISAFWVRERSESSTIILYSGHIIKESLLLIFHSREAFVGSRAELLLPAH